MDEARCKCRRDKRNLTPSDWAIKLGIGPTRQRAHTLLSSLYILPSTLCALVQSVGNAGASCSSAWATSKCANAATYLKRVLRRRGGPPNCKLHPSSSPAANWTATPLCPHAGSRRRKLLLGARQPRDRASGARQPWDSPRQLTCTQQSWAHPQWPTLLPRSCARLLGCAME